MKGGGWKCRTKLIPSIFSLSVCVSSICVSRRRRRLHHGPFLRSPPIPSHRSSFGQENEKSDTHPAYKTHTLAMRVVHSAPSRPPPLGVCDAPPLGSHAGDHTMRAKPARSPRKRQAHPSFFNVRVWRNTGRSARALLKPKRNSHHP